MKTAEQILIIEDDPVVRHFLKASLMRQKYHINEAATAEDGLSKAAQGAPDLILLDLGLPDIDGIEVVSQLRGWMQTPIIVLSSRD
ncbi:MAG TPA: response regulator [Abditibacterium sp.]